MAEKQGPADRQCPAAMEKRCEPKHVATERVADRKSVIQGSGRVFEIRG